MRNRRERIRRAFALLLAVAGLITCAAPSSASSGLASAQATAPSWSYTGSLNTVRFGHTTTLLPNGKVLVVGGCNVSGCLDSAELYDPVTGTWGLTGGLRLPRASHTATLLPNGKVLVAGGIGITRDPNQFVWVSSAELYDPVAGTWSLTGNLNVARSDHSATLLPDGKVLVAGGGNTGFSFQSQTELYDPTTGTWSVTGNLNMGRVGHTATLLPNGKVLFAGGTAGDFSFHNLSSSELYDPNTGTWSLTGSLNVARFGLTATLLPNGNVLVTGGESQDFGVINNSAELYNPTTGTWSYTGSPSTGRVSHTATLLPNGQVLVAGGLYYVPDNNMVRTTYLDSAEIYDPATGSWSGTAKLSGTRHSHAAVLLHSGKVLVFGGWDGTNRRPLQSAELYDSGSGSTINPIDDPQFFVRQQYRDFLSREPEEAGLNAWLGVLNACPDIFTPPQTPSQCDRITVSSSFFLSPEFRLKGSYVFTFYRVAFDRLADFSEIIPDMQSVTGQTPADTFARRAAFPVSFTQRQEFRARFDLLSDAAFVAALLDRYGLQSITTPDPQNPEDGQKVTLTRADLTSRLGGGALTRAAVLRAVVESDEVSAAEFTRAFVAMQYYGYLRRAPEEGGYNAWLNYLRTHPGDFRTMVHGFVNSIEYRMRFGQP